MAEENMNGRQPAEQSASEQSQIRLGKLKALASQGMNPYELTKFDRTHLSSQVVAEFSEEEQKTVSIAGRMVSRRIMGKASFAHLLDLEGKI